MRAPGKSYGIFAEAVSQKIAIIFGMEMGRLRNTDEEIEGRGGRAVEGVWWD